MRLTTGLACLAFAAAACQPSTPTRTGPDLVFQGPAGSVTPNLAASPSGEVVLTFLEPASDSSHALRVTAWTGDSWTTPTTVHEGHEFFVNWADFPSIAVSAPGVWTVHWLQKTAERPYAYHVLLKTTTDAGGTWIGPVRAHADSSPTEHGFVALLPRGEGGVTAAWLDGQAMGQDPPGPMSVRVGEFDAALSRLSEIVIDARTCECCQVAMARTSQGLVAAWRDRSETEIRDVAVSREVNGEWTPPVIPAPDGWEHRACPVNGPALAADGLHLGLAWYTGANDAPTVKLIQSGDGGVTFGAPVQLDEGQTLGRVDLEPLGEGAVAAVWLEPAGEDEAVWKLRRIDADGRAGPVHSILTVTRARRAGFPRMVRTGDELLVALLATGEGADGGVRVFRVPLEGL